MKRLLVILVVLFVVAGVLTTAGILLSDRPLTIRGQKILTLTLDDTVVDYLPAIHMPFVGTLERESLASIYRAVAAARSDDDVEALALTIRGARMGLATAQELRGLVLSLRAEGKRVECYLETAGEGNNGTVAYYLASACDHVSMPPAGELNVVGLYSDALFLRGTLDKLRIRPDFFSEGAYKSAAESWTETEHSPAAEEALATLLDDLFGQIVGDVATARGLEAADVESLIDGAPYLPSEALELGLVDELAYPDQFWERVDARFSGVQRVELAQYRRSLSTPSGPRVAVVFAQGTILRGGSGVDPWTDEMVIGSDDMGSLLGRLAEAEGVSAVVLRIDSPGGSALASDLILRSVEVLGRRKPVVVSMSDLAASGGYYIAAKARHVVAWPATITGSIGVVGGKLTTRDFQQELLGITHDELKRGANADMYSTLDPFRPEQADHYRRMMGETYETFKGHVAEGRELTPDEVEAVAQGRVWSGDRALGLGLVDGIGGLDEAIAAARSEAGIAEGEEVRIDFYPRSPGLLDLLLENQPLVRGSLSAEVVLRALTPRPVGTLQLPREIAALADL